MAKPKVYYLQNRAIHRARLQLGTQGTLDPAGLDQVRAIAAELNLGIHSISRLSLRQREVLIDRLKSMGAQVKNPHLYDSDLEAERRLSGSREPRKVLIFGRVKESQLRMLDALANQIEWRTPDGYLRFCNKLLKAPRPRNSKEVTTLRLALQSLLDQQPLAVAASPKIQSRQTPVDNQPHAGLPPVH